MIVFVLLYLTFRNLTEAALIMGTLPFALIGGLWLMFLLGYNLSIASAIGFIALAGVAAEFGVVMLIYLDHAVATLPGAAPLTASPRKRISLRQ
jgi:Cu(I)/Ag(I) efflux system membrane protein CusA/SilA